MSLHQSSGRWRLGLFLALVTVSLWGVLAVALKIVLQTLDAYTVTWFRFLVAFLLLAIYLAPKSQLPNLKALQPSGWILLAIATLGLAGNYILFLEGLGHTSANNAQVIIQLSPVMLGLSSLVVFKEHYTRQQWAGLSTILAGMVIFSHEQLVNLVTAKADYLWGNLLLALAALTWAIYALAQKQLLQVLSSRSIMLCIYGFSALLFSPFASPTKILTLDPLHLALLGFCALNTLFAYGSFAEALEHWEASRVSAVLTLTPLVTLGTVSILSEVYPQLFKTELLSWLGLLGAALVIVGSANVSLGGRKLKSSLEEP